MVPQEAQDEFEEQAAAAEATSGYEGSRDADIEDQREYRLIPRDTACVLQVTKFELAAKGSPCILAKVEIVSPEDFADGASNFTKRIYIDAAVKEGKKGSAWDMAKRDLSYIYAAITQQEATPAWKELSDPVYEAIGSIGPDEVQAFREALVERLNEVCVEEAFEVVIGQEAATFETDAKGQVVMDEDGQPKVKYRAKQSFGKFNYPKAAKK